MASTARRRRGITATLPTICMMMVMMVATTTAVTRTGIARRRTARAIPSFSSCRRPSFIWTDAATSGSMIIVIPSNTPTTGSMVVRHAVVPIGIVVVISILPHWTSSAHSIISNHHWR